LKENGNEHIGKKEVEDTTKKSGRSVSRHTEIPAEKITGYEYTKV